MKIVYVRTMSRELFDDQEIVSKLSIVFLGFEVNPENVNISVC